MANKKRKISRKAQPKKTPKRDARSEIMGVILIAVGLFFGLIFLFDNMGLFGKMFSTLLKWVLGNAVPVTALFVIWMGISLITLGPQPYLTQ